MSLHLKNMFWLDYVFIKKQTYLFNKTKNDEEFSVKNERFTVNKRWKIEYSKSSN